MEKTLSESAGYVLSVSEGRPREKRTEQENAIYDRLEALQIPFLRADHAPADHMEACKAIEKALDGVICKNLFLCNRQQTDFYLLLLPPDKVFKTKYLSSQLNCARLSFATPEHLDHYLHTRPGSASLLELLFDTDHHVRLVIDNDLRSDQYLCCHPGFSVSTVKLLRTDALRYVASTGHEPIWVDLPTELSTDL